MTTDTTYVCDLDVNGWQLYSYEDEDGEAKARAQSKRRAASLSKRMTKLVNAAFVRLGDNSDLSERKLAEGVRDEMYKLMSKYSDSGACDTEPQCVLVGELERAFDLEQWSLER